MSAEQRCFALFVNLLGAHANLGDLRKDSRGIRRIRRVAHRFARACHPDGKRGTCDTQILRVLRILREINN
jgi:hypothetical protein